MAPTEAPDTQLRPVLTAAAWTAADMRAREHEWTYHLTPNDIQELDEALVLARAMGKPIHELTQEDFPLPLLAPKLRALGSEVVHGRGFQIIKGNAEGDWGHEGVGQASELLPGVILMSATSAPRPVYDPPPPPSLYQFPL